MQVRLSLLCFGSLLSGGGWTQSRGAITITYTDHNHPVTHPTAQLTYVDRALLTDHLTHSNWIPYCPVLMSMPVPNNSLILLKGALEKTTILINKINSRFKQL